VLKELENERDALIAAKNKILKKEKRENEERNRR